LRLRLLLSPLALAALAGLTLLWGLSAALSLDRNRQLSQSCHHAERDCHSRECDDAIGLWHDLFSLSRVPYHEEST
jgi:hypothetical protein